MGGFILPVLGAVTSLFGGMGGGKSESYAPAEKQFQLDPGNPQTQSPQVGIDNTEDQRKGSGTSSLAIPRDQKRQPSVGVTGGSASGVSVPKS
jgi:hypothetical protein